MTRVNITTETKSPTMKFGLDVATITVKARLGITLAAANQDTRQNVAMVVTMDESGSTAAQIAGGSFIFNTEKDAAKATAFQMEEGDSFGLITFDDQTRKILDPTKCDAAGRDAIAMALAGLRAKNGMTNYNGALNAAYNMIRGVSGANRVIPFLTDGQYNEGGDPLPLAERILSEGVMICTAAITNTLSAEDEALLKAMSGGTKFKVCKTAAEVTNFLASALKQAKNAALTNVTLSWQAIGLVTEITAFDRVSKDGKRGFIPGNITPQSDKSPARATIDLGELGPNETVEVYVAFKLKPVPKPKDGRTYQKRTFGDMLVFAACPAEGVTTPTEAGKDEMYQDFAVATSGAVNPAVDKFEAEWVAASAFDAISKTDNTAAQQEIAKYAAAKIRKTMVVVDDDEGTMENNAVSLEDLARQSATQGAEAAQKSAGRRTAVFTDED